jgi:hypothetical protein
VGTTFDKKIFMCWLVVGSKGNVWCQSYVKCRAAASQDKADIHATFFYALRILALGTKMPLSMVATS